MTQYEKQHIAANIIQRAIKKYNKCLGYSKCYICREQLYRRFGEDNKIVQVKAAPGKLGLFAHKTCIKSNTCNNSNNICPFCNVEVLDRYRCIQSVWGNIKNEPLYVNEKTSNVIQKWHSECHRAMTYGFPIKAKLNNIDKKDNTWRGNCLVCETPVWEKQCSRQVQASMVGEHGTYIHDKCFMTWITPKFHFYKLFTP